MAKVLGFNAMASGAGLLPMMGTFMVTSFIAGRLYELFGPKLIVSLGALFLAAGMFLLSAITADDDLQPAHPRNGRARYRSWSVLFVGHDGGDHGARSIARQPGGRYRLYVPDCRRIDWRRLQYRDRRFLVIDAGRESIPRSWSMGPWPICSALVAIVFVGGAVNTERLRELRHHHRAHA